MPPSEYDDGMEVPEPEFRPVPRRHCPADCSCREQLRAENERLLLEHEVALASLRFFNCEFPLMEADTARLDWLEAQWVPHGALPIDYLMDQKRDIRAAIDAARKEAGDG
jgi:hypothetical protein